MLTLSARCILSTGKSSNTYLKVGMVVDVVTGVVTGMALNSIFILYHTELRNLFFIQTSLKNEHTKICKCDPFCENLPICAETTIEI